MFLYFWRVPCTNSVPEWNILYERGKYLIKEEMETEFMKSM